MLGSGWPAGSGCRSHSESPQAVSVCLVPSPRMRSISSAVSTVQGKDAFGPSVIAEVVVAGQYLESHVPSPSSFHPLAHRGPGTGRSGQRTL
jgi:hypothetical protein